MTTRRCRLCGCVLHGRSDKQYCSSTCRRDASRVRKRTIRFAGCEVYGSEWLQSDSVESVLIPKLERLHGRNHRLVHEARRQAERLREAELERLSREMQQLAWTADGEQRPPPATQSEVRDA